MDINSDTEMGNATVHFNSTSFKPHDDVEVSIYQLFQVIKSMGISELFKKLSPNSRNCVIAYLLMFMVGAPGNLYVVISVGWKLYRRSFARSSRVKLFIWHLALADLFVTFVVIPIEIFWRLTLQWFGGNMLCKFIQFVRAFGLYLSSMIIVCIGLDRFWVIVFPLRSIGGIRRINRMLLAAWTFSILFAAPQAVVFSVQKHPLYPSFHFCTNSHYFSTLNQEILYNLLSLVVMYFAPLLVTIITVALVLISFSKNNREQRLQTTTTAQGQVENGYLQQTGNTSEIERAKTKAIWMSMLIVSIFVLCWTPYIVSTLWYMFDFESAERLVGPTIREALFVTAVSNSCLNPIIYGDYMKKFWRCIFQCGCLHGLGTPSISAASSAIPVTSHHHNIMSDSVL